MTDKEITLTIRVPQSFGPEDERILNHAFARVLEEQGLKLVNTGDYRDTLDSSIEPESKQIIPAQALPQGWKWGHWPDGSGALCSPEGNLHFSYDCTPYCRLGGIEYEKDPSTGWNVFWGSLEQFRDFAEKVISQDLIHTENPTIENTPKQRPTLDAAVKDAKLRSAEQSITTQIPKENLEHSHHA